MRRRLLALALLPLLLPLTPDAVADDSITLYGNYYKERSTRVYEPMVRVVKDLPQDIELDVMFAVDQITSASGSFVGGEDRAFSEFREEVEVSVKRKMNDLVRVGVQGRVSYEPDFTSARGGAEVRLSLVPDLTMFTVYGQYQRDWVRERNGMIDDYLKTTVLGVSLTQVLRRDMIGGLTLEGQILRGYQENAYRAETHPRERDRYCARAWLAYRSEITRTTLKGGYRMYGDNWKIRSHVFDFDVAQSVIGTFELLARFRHYNQSAAYFADVPTEDFQTMDPKLMRYTSWMLSGGMRIPLSIFRGTVLDGISDSRVEPMYSYYKQNNLYGIAHIAQLGWYLPF